MAEVKARVPGAGDAQDTVGVGLVVGAEPARLVDQVDEFLDPGVEYPGILRVGDEQARCPLRDRGFQRLQVGIAVLVRIESDDLEPCGLGAGRVGGMGKDGGDDLVALARLAAGLVIGPDQRDIGVDGHRPRTGLQRETVHTRDLFEDAFEAVHDLQNTLNRFLILQGMKIGHLWTARQLIVDLGAVLHGAGPLPHVDVEIGPQVLLRQPDIVPQYLGLGQLGQVGWLFPPHSSRDARQDISGLFPDLSFDLGHEDASLALAAQLKDNWLIPAGLVETAHIGLSSGESVRSDILAHRSTTSFNAAASRSISSLVWTSVTQNRALWPNSGNSAVRSLPPKIPRASSARLISATV